MNDFFTLFFVLNCILMRWILKYQVWLQDVLLKYVMEISRSFDYINIDEVIIK